MPRNAVLNIKSRGSDTLVDQRGARMRYKYGYYIHMGEDKKFNVNSKTKDRGVSSKVIDK